MFCQRKCTKLTFEKIPAGRHASDALNAQRYITSTTTNKISTDICISICTQRLNVNGPIVKVWTCSDLFGTAILEEAYLLMLRMSRIEMNFGHLQHRPERSPTNCNVYYIYKIVEVFEKPFEETCMMELAEPSGIDSDNTQVPIGRVTAIGTVESTTAVQHRSELEGRVH